MICMYGGMIGMTGPMIRMAGPMIRRHGPKPFIPYCSERHKNFCRLTIRSGYCNYWSGHSNQCGPMVRIHRRMICMYGGMIRMTGPMIRMAGPMIRMAGPMIRRHGPKPFIPYCSERHKNFCRLTIRSGYCNHWSGHSNHWSARTNG